MHQTLLLPSLRDAQYTLNLDQVGLPRRPQHISNIMIMLPKITCSDQTASIDMQQEEIMITQ